MPFNSKEFTEFAKSWDFKIVTSSPTYPQSNGLVERNVQSIKRLLKKAHDEGKAEELALLEFRNTPITGLNESPAQLLMSRCLHSSLPITEVVYNFRTGPNGPDRTTPLRVGYLCYYPSPRRS